MAIAWIDTPPAEFADLARRLWSGETPASAAAAQQALLEAHVKSPFRVGWVAVDVPGYGEQLICTLEYWCLKEFHPPHQQLPDKPLRHRPPRRRPWPWLRKRLATARPPYTPQGWTWAPRSALGG